MPPFPEPDFEYEYDLPTERTALREWRDDERHVPAKAPDRLLIATWNVANLGHPGQARTDEDYGVIAELLSWFDLVTVQEVNDNLAGLRKLEDRLSATHQTLDQVAFFPPGASEQALVQASEVFDFDGALFKDLWEDRGKDDYFEYVRYHISDHRLLWAELAV